MSTQYGITAAIGADQLLAAGTITTTLAITGAAVGMVVSVTPETFPGPGIFWDGLVTAPDTVRVKVTTVLAGEIPTSRYFVAVNTDTGGGPGPSSGVLTASVHISSAELQAGGPNKIIVAGIPGRVLIPIAAFGRYEFGTIPYTAGGGGNNVVAVSLIGATSVTINGGGFSVADLTESGVYPAVGLNDQQGFTPDVNEVGIPISTECVGFFVDGDGTLDITVWYLVGPEVS